VTFEHRAPPESLDALRARANTLVGRRLVEIAWALGGNLEDNALRTKGKAGAVIEAALGASGKGKVHDFPELQVELKTIPLTAAGLPKESTYVCTLKLEEAASLDWHSSWAKQKLSRILWVATDGHHLPLEDRTVRECLFYQCPKEDEARLQSDFEQIVGLISTGRMEEVTSHLGTCMQLRPKARDGAKTKAVRNEDGDMFLTTPKGFYLRPTFTAEILARLRTGQ
jgi:DNA mismatch repair protein MutH